jgi:hypothetical protein
MFYIKRSGKQAEAKKPVAYKATGYKSKPQL